MAISFLPFKHPRLAAQAEESAQGEPEAQPALCGPWHQLSSAVSSTGEPLGCPLTAAAARALLTAGCGQAGMDPRLADVLTSQSMPLCSRSVLLLDSLLSSLARAGGCAFQLAALYCVTQLIPGSCRCCQAVRQPE